MICVYDRMATAYEGHGLGVLHPTRCEISEDAGGAYEATIDHPLTETREGLLLAPGVVIRVPGPPKREAAREQLFRVMRVSRSEDGTSVVAHARHISYDLMYNSVGSVVHEEKVPARQVAAELMAALEDKDHGFTLIADGLTKPVAGSWEMSNGVNALLDQEAGLVRMARARLIRDNHVIRLLPEGAPESGVTIRYGRNMTGLQLEEDEESVYTRLVPVGETAEGEDLFLPERYVDSPRLPLYPRPRVMMWRVPGAKVGGKVSGSDATLTEEGVYDLMRKAAQEKLGEGVDEPRRELQAGYIDLGATEEYAAYGVLQTVCLYDRVSIRHDPQEISLQIDVSGYTWDALAGRYTVLKLGDVYADKTANVIVTAPQLAQHRRSTGRQLMAANGRMDIIADEIYIQGEYIQLLATKEEVTAQGFRLSRVEIDLDAANARIDLKAERTELIEGMGQIRSDVSIALDAVNSRIDLKAERSEVQNEMLTIRSEVSVALDAVNSRIDLEAERRNELLGEVNTAKVAINGLEASVALKASQTAFNDLAGRVSTAEAALVVQAGEISAKVSAGGIASAINQNAQSVLIQASKINLSGYVTASQLEATTATINNLMAGREIATSILADNIGINEHLTIYKHQADWYARSFGTSLSPAKERVVQRETISYMGSDGKTHSVSVVTGITNLNEQPTLNTTTYRFLGYSN